MAIKNTLKVLLPAWWLPNGTIKASNQELEGASSSCEWWGVWFAALVIIAVVAEFFISWAEPAYLLFLKLSTLADAAVAIGITGEIGLGTIWNNRIQTELRKRSNETLALAVQSAAQARERAAEIEKLTAWRHVSPEQYRRLGEAIRAEEIANRLHVLIEWQTGDPEAFSYGKEIAQIFVDSGVGHITGGSNFFPSGTVFGLHLRASQQSGTALRLGEAFARAELPVTTVTVGSEMARYMPPNSFPPDLYIFVAPKPPPILVFPAQGEDATTAAKTNE